MFAYCIHHNLDQLGADNIICAWIVWNKKLLCCPQAHGFQMRNINQVDAFWILLKILYTREHVESLKFAQCCRKMKDVQELGSRKSKLPAE
ncbi:hypothetical protein NC651_036791 [Populus alba x Populus x berolinensis]|nr:hypothetical protein NC651_036791 [Populus alba x Populus x berolinensis]